MRTGARSLTFQESTLYMCRRLQISVFYDDFSFHWVNFSNIFPPSRGRGIEINASFFFSSSSSESLRKNRKETKLKIKLSLTMRKYREA